MGLVNAAPTDLRPSPVAPPRNPTIPQKVTNVSIYNKGSEPRAWELRPYERSRWAEHGKLCHRAIRGVPAPPGIVMVAPPTTQRNASRRQSEGRARKWRPKKRGQGQSIKAGAPYPGRCGSSDPMFHVRTTEAFTL